MRLSRTDLRRRVNGRVEYRFDLEQVTSYGGLELVREFLQGLGFRDRVRRLVERSFPKTDFGVTSMLLLLLGLLIVGGRRVWHLRYMQSDPIVARFAGLHRLPSTRTVSGWLARLSSSHVARLVRLNSEMVAEALKQEGLSRLTIDVDGSVVSTGLKVEGAKRGFNPHHRKVPSYYPITAYEAQSGQILRVQNRPGNVHDGKASLDFLSSLIEQLRETVDWRCRLEFRMDGAFFRRDVLDFLDSHGAEYAIKVPFYPWLQLKTAVALAPEWKPIDETVSYCETRTLLRPWKQVRRIVLYRKRVAHETRKNFQLDLFDPDDGHYEYSAITTNKDLNGRNLWHFLNGRGTHEKAYAELRNGFAFNCVPSLKAAANAVWQVLSVLAFNLTRSFQVAIHPDRRSRSRKRRTLHPFDTIHTLRFKILARAGVLFYPAGRATLDLGTSPATEADFNRAIRALRAA
jgi:Transposase DDE domain group 1